MQTQVDEVHCRQGTFVIRCRGNRKTDLLQTVFWGTAQPDNLDFIFLFHRTKRPGYGFGHHRWGCRADRQDSDVGRQCRGRLGASAPLWSLWMAQPHRIPAMGGPTWLSLPQELRPADHSSVSQGPEGRGAARGTGGCRYEPKKDMHSHASRP